MFFTHGLLPSESLSLLTPLRVPLQSHAGQGQLGAEGFIMGTLYSSFGLAAAGLVSLVPRMKDKQSQRVVGYGLLFVMLRAYRFVVSNHHWKTGLTTHWYFF